MLLSLPLISGISSKTCAKEICCVPLDLLIDIKFYFCKNGHYAFSILGLNLHVMLKHIMQGLNTKGLHLIYECKWDIGPVIKLCKLI